MKAYGIFSPTLGLNNNYPSILLKDAYIPDLEENIFQKGEIWSAKKRNQLFTQALPDEINHIRFFFKQSMAQNWLVVFTKRDVVYRDVNNNRFVFINKIYNTGTLTNAVNSSGGTMILTFSGTTMTTNTRVGDFIRIVGGSGSPYHTGQTWYPIVQIISDTQLKVTGSVPSGYTIGSGGNGYAIRKTFTGVTTDYWSTVVFNEKLLGTNNGVDNIFSWNGSGQLVDMTMTGISPAYKAKRLYVYERRLLLLQPIESGTLKPFDICWSTLNNETLWGGSGSDAGRMDCSEGEGVVQNCVNIQGFLYVIKDSAIIKAWPVENTDIFNKKLYINGTGTDAPESVIEKDDKAYFWDARNRFISFDGIQPLDISRNIDTTVKNINPNYQKYIAGSYIEQYNQIYWAVPFSTSTVRDKIIFYDLDPEEVNWGLLNIPASTFGVYDQETTYDWATLPFIDWASWTWESWAHREGLQTFPLNIVGSTDGKIHQLNATEQDLGNTFTRYFVLETDLSKNKSKLNIFKRLLAMDIYIEKEATGSMTIQVKRDKEAIYQSTDGIVLTGNEDILIKRLPIDFTAKLFSLKFSATTRFRFLGIIFWFEELGDR